MKRDGQTETLEDLIAEAQPYLARYLAAWAPLEVLQSATVNPARVFGMPTGVEVGQGADFVLLEANPLTDITAYRTPGAVYTQGRFFGRQALETLRDSARVD